MSPAWFLVRSPLPPLTVWWVGGWLGFCGCEYSAASSLPGVGVGGSSRSQESPVLTDLSPVASSVSAGRDRWSRSREIGGSTGDRSHSCSSCLSPSRGRDSREGLRCACSRSRELYDRSCELSSRSMDRSRSCGRKCSRRDSSRSPSASVRSRPSDRYRDR